MGRDTFQGGNTSVISPTNCEAIIANASRITTHGVFYVNFALCRSCAP